MDGIGGLLTFITCSTFEISLKGLCDFEDFGKVRHAQRFVFIHRKGLRGAHGIFNLLLHSPYVSALGLKLDFWPLMDDKKTVTARD